MAFRAVLPNRFLLDFPVFRFSLQQRPYTFAQTKLPPSRFACGEAADHTFAPALIERRENQNLVCHRHLCADRHRQEGTETRRLALHLSTDSVGLDLRENRDFMRLQPYLHRNDQPAFANQLNLFDI